MKKLLFALIAVALIGLTQSKAQTVVPADCQNSGMLMGKVQAQEAQGWDATSFSTSYVLYKIQPEPPYLAGTLTITYVPSCEPWESCLEIAKIDRVDLWIINNSGTCQYREGNN